MSDFDDVFDSYQLIARLRRMQAEPADPAEATVEPTQAAMARERRRLRLRAAGMVEPRATAAAMESIGRCPRSPGSAASERMAREVEAFLRSGMLQTLVLVAAPGRGKSFVAAWLIAESTARSMWLPAAECRVGPSWDALRVRAASIPLLVVDDLGEEGSSEWGIREMSTLLQGRHNAGLRTVVTTNFLTPELDARYGERLMSRWSEVGISRVVTVEGADLRKRKP